MFHLFNKVYVVYCNDANAIKHDAKRIITSKLARDYQLENELTLMSAESLDHLLYMYFNQNIQEFINYLLLAEDKLFIYVNRDDYNLLLLMLLKSVFRITTASNLLPIYQIYQDQERLWMDLWDKETKKEMALGISLSEVFDTQLGKAPTVNIPNKTLGVEYLLPYYFESRHELHTELLDRTQWLITRKLYREYVDIKRTVLKYGYLINNIPGFESVSNEPGKLIRTLEKNEETKWLFDPQFKLSNIDYCIKNYKPEALAKVFEYIHFEGLPANDGIYGYFNHLEDKKTLLKRDIETGLQSPLMNSFDDMRLNTYLVSYFYTLIRNKDKEKLKQYQLK